MSDNKQEDVTKREFVSPGPAPAAKKHNRKDHILCRAIWVLTGIVVLFFTLCGLALLFLRSSAGEAWLTRTLNEALLTLPSGISCRVQQIHAPLPFGLQFTGITLSDTQGVWLEAEAAKLQVDWRGLPEAITVTQLDLERPHILRLPQTNAKEVDSPASGSHTPQEITELLTGLFQKWPVWFPAWTLESLLINKASLEASILGFAMQATLNASARLEKEGFTATLNIQRDDANCRPLTMNAVLSPALELTLNARGSDLGLISLLPEQLGQQANMEFCLTGAGNPSLLKTKLSMFLQERDSQNQILSASADADIHLIEISRHPFPVSASLTLETGPAASRFWSLVGQKSGALRVQVKALASQEHPQDMSLATTIELSDMSWNEALLSTLLGSKCQLQGSANVRIGHEKDIEFSLATLMFKAAMLNVLAQGQLSLPHASLLSADTSVSLHAECELSDAGGFSSNISGTARLTGDISGTANSLHTKLSFTSDKLAIAGTNFTNTQADIIIPQADLPQMLEKLPRLAETFHTAASFSDTVESPTVRGTPTLPANTTASRLLLNGQLKAAFLVNGQHANLNTLWYVNEQGEKSDRQLVASLDTMEVHLEKNVVSGQIICALPLKTSPSKAGTLTTVLGITPPALDGSLNIHIPDWKSVSRITGMNFSGSPLKMALAMSSQKKQSLSWQGTLADFHLQFPEGNITLSGVNTRLELKDLWNTPDIAFSAKLRRLDIPSLSLTRVSADVKSNKNKADIILQSYGDIQSDTILHWHPEKCVLEKIAISISPEILGLAGKGPLGVRLKNSVSLRHKNSNFSLPSATFLVQPSGQIDISGSYSPERITLSLDITRLNLAEFRSFSQVLPAGTLDCHAAFSGSMSYPSGNFKLYLNDIQIPGSSLPSLTAAMTGNLGASGKTRVLTVALELPGKTRQALGLTSCEAQLEVPFTSPAQGMSVPDPKGRLRGNIVLVGELAQFWKLMPLADQRLSGQIMLSSSLSGRLTAPEITLHGTLNNGRFADIVQGIELRNIRTSVSADNLNILRKSGGRLEFVLYAEDSRKGSLSFNGWFDPKEWQLAVNGDIKHLSPLRRQDVTVMLSGSLGMNGSVENPHVKADITIDKGQIQLASLPGSDIVTLPIEEPDKKTPTPVSSPIQGSLDVRVHIPNQFFIRGYGLECEWKGDIMARGTMTRPGITGNIQAVRGGLDVLGKHFQLSEGRITFDGGWPISPMLNIIMEYTASNITADVTVSGSATKPEITLSSQPVMPQDEIISQIMFGQSAGTLSHVQALQLAAGAAELAGLGGPDVMGFGRRLLGLDVFKLNSENSSADNGNSDMSKTSLEMGTYVLDNVYVGVEQGIGRESETDAVVEIELTPSLEAQAKASSNRTEFGLEWKKNY